LKAQLQKALSETEAFWGDLRVAYAWVHRAAHLLNNEAKEDILEVRRQFRELLSQMSPFRQHPGLLGEAATQFFKVTRSYWRGLFACYEVADLPRTNNALEQQFGSYRHSERRCTGRKVASAMTVVRGPVRLVAALATPANALKGEDLRPLSLPDWRSLRQQLQKRHEERAQQRRFRKDPQAYLAQLEERLLKVSLPT
jgi:hypothetical protein